VIVSGELPAFCERVSSEATGNGEAVQEYMTWSVESGVSLVTSIRAARECARTIRDVLSSDVWEEINELYHFLGRPEARHLYAENRDELYRSVRRATQLILGLVRSTMLHEEPMSFLWLGVMLERVSQTARILDMHHHTMEKEHAHDIVHVALWVSLLRACSGSQSFMKKHQGRVRATAVASFLLLDPSFPRSLRYCLKSAHRILGEIWPEPLERPSIAHAAALLSALPPKTLSFEGSDVHELLTHIVDETSEICSLVSTEIQGPARSVTSSESAAQ
jgi:uncharacterized alpha-E superfamily protein